MCLYGFDPIIADEPRLLILGSMPSVTSLAKQEYYGYRHNRFWKVLQAYFDLPLNSYEDKRNCILTHHIILWDVIGSCEREGSLDSAIRKEECNDIAGLLATYPSIQRILCNGKKSYDLYQRHFAHLSQRTVIAMPSTSNANRTISEAVLFQKWFEQLDQVSLMENGDCHSFQNRIS